MFTLVGEVKGTRVIAVDVKARNVTLMGYFECCPDLASLTNNKCLFLPSLIISLHELNTVNTRHFDRPMSIGMAASPRENTMPQSLADVAHCSSAAQ